MHLDSETMGALWFACADWDLVGSCLRTRTEAERASSRERSLKHYRSRKNDPAFRAKNAARRIARYHAQKAAEGKASKRGKDKKLSVELRAEIATSTERVRDLAVRFGVSPQAISWIRKHWKTEAA